MKKQIFVIVCLFVGQAASGMNYGKEVPAGSQASAMKPGVVDISGLDKAKVLIALFAKAMRYGLGCQDCFNNYTEDSPGNLSYERAQKILEESCYVDYLDGVRMKVDLSGDTLETSNYNYGSGRGVAEREIESLKLAKK